MVKSTDTKEPSGRRRKSLRDIVEINEDLCDGCGLCLPFCAEGALTVESGKLVLMSEAYCDGLGNCIGRCPKGALSIVKRLSDDYIRRDATNQNLGQDGSFPFNNEQNFFKNEHKEFDISENDHKPIDISKIEERAFAKKQSAISTDDLNLANLIDALEQNEGIRPFPGLEETKEHHKPAFDGVYDFEFTQDVIFPDDRRSLVSWPIQLALLNPRRFVVDSVALVVAADCVAFASPVFHQMFLHKDNPLVIGCPKLDDFALYVAKLGVILRDNPLLTVLQLPIMDVPCCRNLWRLAREALKISKRLDVKLLGWIFSSTGRPLESSINLAIEYGGK
jgi:ferredoxin